MSTNQSDTWSFTTGIKNDPPEIPHNPSPSDQATDVSADATLSWLSIDPDGDEVTSDVYLGTDSNLDVDDLIVEDHNSNSFNPGNLELNTTYYWKVIATDNNLLTSEGPVWMFKTRHHPIDIEIKIPFFTRGKISANVKNNGAGSFSNAQWNITVKSVFSDKIDVSTEGVINTLVTNSGETIETDELSGLSVIQVNVKLEVQSKTISEERIGIILGRIIILI
jgi:hypothetical protein